MVFEEPGPVTDRIRMLGSRLSCLYLLDGGTSLALLGGGMATVIPQVESQIAALDIDAERIQQLVILHAHFDHCGIVPYFKRKWPWLEITASARAAALLATPHVIDSVRRLNQMIAAEQMPKDERIDRGLRDFHIDIDTTLAEGDVLECGDRPLQVMETPGHSSCSICLYEPVEKALFTSDAAGIPFGRYVFTAANSNYDRYLESLKRLEAMDADIVLAEHQGARQGHDCREFFNMSLRSAEKTRHLLETSYARTGDIQESTREVTAQVLENAPPGFLPASVVSLVVGQMLRYLSRNVSKV